MTVDTTNMMASEIDILKCDKERELQYAQEDLHRVEIEELTIAKQIVELQSKRKDLQIAKSKAQQVVRTLILDIKILTSEFFRAKDNR